MKRQLPTGRPVIGLVGGVGAGKSTVAGEMARLGAVVVDADALGHRLLATPAVRRAVRARWGPSVFAAGEVDRRALGQIVFARKRELAALNAILHPRIRRAMRRVIAAARKMPAVVAVVLDAAVLFEAGWDDLCSAVVFVQAPAAARLRRVAAAKGWTRPDWRRRENAQISLDKKRGKSDYIVVNGSSVPRLRDQVRRTFLTLVHAAERPRR
jgi:dephospho-CoA kinase